ncbi:MAG: hypothetical protein R3B68_02995 [Phycisphaerales bacterium]
MVALPPKPEPDSNRRTQRMDAGAAAPRPATPMRHARRTPGTHTAMTASASASRGCFGSSVGCGSLGTPRGTRR